MNYIEENFDNLDYLIPNNNRHGCLKDSSKIIDIEDFSKINKKEVDQSQFIDVRKAVNMIIKNRITTRKELDKYLIKLRRIFKRQFSHPELLYSYRSICQEKKIVECQKVINMFQKKSCRSQSGVMVVAIFTSAYPNGQKFSCEYDCWYCPSEPNQPRSYLLKEPGVLRANRNNFDPILQVWDRLHTYHTLGHPLDKLEVIVLGGTWSSYPEDYREKFIRDAYYAANTYFDKITEKELREKDSLIEERLINKTSKIKIIGLTLETRPDRISSKELKEFRNYGATRIQLGVQHTNNRVLKRIDRRCNTKHTKRAIRLLKDNCFKVDVHLMPNLPNPFKENIKVDLSNYTKEDIDDTVNMVEEDREMFRKFLYDQEFQVDQWKIYPFEVVPFSRAEEDYKKGLYVPYGEQVHREFNELHELLIEVKSQVPIWVRLNRVIRDIPSEYIIGGPKDVSMRQTLKNEMNRRGLKCKCIRCREIKKKEFNFEDSMLFIEKYKSSNGDEYFLSYESKDREHLLGFLRLRISENSGRDNKNIIFEELEDTAMIRELHVYGETTAVKKNNNLLTKQHRGLGSSLVEKSIEISEMLGYKRIAVISGDGVKGYYERFGFKDNGNFMIRRLYPFKYKVIQFIKSNFIFINSIIFIIFLFIFKL